MTTIEEKAETTGSEPGDETGNDTGAPAVDMDTLMAFVGKFVGEVCLASTVHAVDGDAEDEGGRCLENP